MHKLKICYEGVAECHADILRRLEGEVRKALPTVFTVMAGATWTHSFEPGDAEDYFVLEINTRPRTMVGEFGLRFLKATTESDFCAALERIRITSMKPLVRW